MKSKEEILHEFLTEKQCWSLNNDSYWKESGVDNILAAMEHYAKQNSHKHGVMQVPDSKCQFCQGTGLDQMDINVQLAKNQGTTVASEGQEKHVREGCKHLNTEKLFNDVYQCKICDKLVYP